MKRLTVLQTACALASFLMLAACTQDEQTNGIRLAEGKYPLELTAAGLQAVATPAGASTRATVDGDWEGVQNVAVKVGGTTKEYKVTPDGSNKKIATLSVADGGTPFYWQTTANLTVNAWYPYSEQKPADDALTVEANQNEATNYQASDYLEARDASVTFQEPKLTFTHRTAKVVVTLQTGEGITDLNNVTVTFVNQAGVKGDGSTVTPKEETKDGVTTYTALLVPQKIQGSPFIKVTLGGYDYFYTPTTGDEANLTAGQQHTYTITLKKTGLDVSFQYFPQWTPGNQSDVSGNAQTVTPGTDGNGSGWSEDSGETVTGKVKTN
ncbi:fimbrillin family protein [Bacteroides sp. GD17]|uniref:fimbrillin family protein n=1 Tax=Bacteroides sp. GD17 TaxID=3139826 RepID=UPI0025F58C8F|nr:fimbrillin family protein [uncultured Bacteroides sp.]